MRYSIILFQHLLFDLFLNLGSLVPSDLWISCCNICCTVFALKIIIIILKSRYPSSFPPRLQFILTEFMRLRQRSNEEKIH